ncbi:MAG: UDP-N-acetylmuramoyl-L-alanyl-D-glutamate--2,6-diaminopimelate ligase [Firmicutes bacterium]|nr:UDP-N-acetylmuramoyl-L-alanyl-D-glutamate--2,6-diaminopimelate ligase [Bacillota bacterium]
MKLCELLKDINVLSATANMDMEITGVSYDSRKTEPGHLFVAVTGYAADGHTFIPAAAERGAAAVLCQCVPDTDIPYVQVADSRAALAVLGANWFDHPAEKMTMIGVTGTNGKTTVTYLLKTVLEKTCNARVGLIGTIQNMIGDTVLPTERTTPESFELQALFARMADAGCTHVVMEVSSHALVLHRVDCIPFRVGIFTNLTEDHLDFHKTMEAYRQAKTLLFQRCRDGVFNLDDPAAAPMMEQASCRCFTVSEKDTGADLYAADICLAADHISLTAVTKDGRTPVRLGIPGGFSAYNTLSVLGAAILLGIRPADAADALGDAKSVKGRVEVVPTPGTDYTVLIDYAHTPDALENVLRSVRGFCKGRVIAVFGCGGDRDPMKRPIMGRIGVELSDLAVITSDNPRTEDPNQIIEDILAGVKDLNKPYAVVENRREAIRWAMDHAQKDDIIVLCGKGHETYQILGTKKTHLDEREEVAAHLEELAKE